MGPFVFTHPRVVPELLCAVREGVAGISRSAARGFHRNGHSHVDRPSLLDRAAPRGRPDDDEYGVLLALIAVVVIAALLFLGPKIANVFTYVGSQL